MICAEGQVDGCIPADKLPYFIAIIVGAIVLAIIARRTRDLSTATLSLMAVAIAINVVVGSLTVALRLPLYMDSIGTILVGALAGPWAGALTGVLANILWSFLPIPGGAGPVAAFFAPVAAVIGLMAGFWASQGVFQLRPGDGRIGTFRGLRDGAHGYGATVYGDKGIAQSGGYDGYQPLVVEIVKFFKTGQPPVTPEETLEIYAFMEAADESKREGGKPVTIDSVLAKARKAAAEMKLSP